MEITAKVREGEVEADRDMWEEQNAFFQTLMISSTVMIGGGFGIVVEGTLPENSPAWGLHTFSVCLALGFSMLVLSIGVAMGALHLMSQFMLAKARAQKARLDALYQVFSAGCRDCRTKA